jgi:hypothetical protein
MRKYQEEMYEALVNKKDYYANNVVISTNDDNVTNIYFYGSKIGSINHANKSYSVDHCGFHNACTTARINVIKMVCDDCFHYNMV